MSRMGFVLASVAIALASACGASEIVPSQTVAASTPVSGPHDDAPSLRLPADEHLLSEELDLTVDPAAKSFRGRAILTVRLDRQRDALWLNAAGLRVSRVSIEKDSATTTGRWSDGPEGFASVSGAGPFQPGVSRIVVDYDADFSDSPDTALGHVRRGDQWYAFSELALIQARHVFPSFDEPSAKVPFRVSLTVPARNEAIGNTSEVGRTLAPEGCVRISFAETPPLPAYLIAFAVGPFDVVTAPSVPANAWRSSALPLRGVAVAGKGPKLRRALEVAAKSVQFLEDYFGAKFPFDKLDLVAVPGKRGAMENAGAITLSEGVSLAEDGDALDQRSALVRLVAHEVSHQWLGDSVTLAWWDDMWLNEAFATWMSGKIAAWLDPSLNVDLAILRSVDRTMNVDARSATQPVRLHVNSKDDIENSIDDISYYKGAAVLGMLENWLGADSFRAGVASYVRAHSFGSATFDDVIVALSATSQQPVRETMGSLIERAGLPYVRLATHCAAAQPTVHVELSRFSPLGSNVPTAPQWSVPVCFRYEADSGSRRDCALVTGQSVDVPLAFCPRWLMPNDDARGYYRFGMDGASTTELSKHVGALSTREAMALYESLRAGATQGTLSGADLLDATLNTLGDPRSDILDEAMTTLALLRNWLGEGPAEHALQARVRKIVLPLYESMGTTARRAQVSQDETRRRLKLRTILARAGNDPKTRQALVEDGKKYLGVGTDGKLHPEAISADAVEVALAVLGEDANEPTLRTLEKLVLSEQDDAVHDNLIDAFGRVRNPALASHVRDVVLSGALSGPDIYWIVGTQLASPELRDGTWSWLVANGDRLMGLIHDNGTQLLALRWAGQLCDARYDKEISSWLATMASHVDGGPRVAAQSEERARLCAAQRGAALPALQQLLAAGGASALRAGRD